VYDSNVTNPTARKAFASVGWLLGFVVLTMLMVGSFGPPRMIGSYAGMAVAAILTVPWLRLGWQTVAKWSGKTSAAITTVIMLVLYAAVIYVGWLGARM
jgi:hypothetical protein